MGILTSVDSGSLAMNGSEDIVFSDSSENFVYHGAKIYLDPMQSSDTITIKVYDWDKVAGSYKIYTIKTLTGVQNSPAWNLPMTPMHRCKVTIQQTAGTNRTFNWERLSN